MTTPEDQRQAAIDTLVQAMTQAGVSQEDAEKVAPVLVDGSAEPETT
jgi:LDH2 family malate/lactate/ureidoglycolate dehydrogenase